MNLYVKAVGVVSINADSWDFSLFPSNEVRNEFISCIATRLEQFEALSARLIIFLGSIPLLHCFLVLPVSCVSVKPFSS